MITKVEGYLLIPHELLHVIGYRLVRKPCLYRLGQPYVTLVGPMTPTERLIGLLFPFVACIIAGIILIPVPFIALFAGGPAWAIILTAAPALAFLYAFASIGDLRQAYLLIHQKKAQDKTPFDFLFWPVVTDDPTRVQTSTLILGVCVIILYIIYLLFF